MSPERSLLFAIFKQTILDYIKLDPDSDAVSADFYESESKDFQVAESIIFGKEKIYYGSLTFTFNELCDMFNDITNLNSTEIKKRISVEAKEY